MQTKFCIVLVLFYILGFSQTTVSGKISDELGNPIPECHVHIAKKSTSTMANGEYVIRKVPMGKVKIFVSHTGFYPIDSLIQIDKDAVFNFTLKKLVNELEEIIVTKKANSTVKSVSEQTVNSSTIQKFSNQSLGDALREVTGVSSLKAGSTIVKPIINGLSGSRVPIISNNVRVEDQEWGTEHAPNIDLNVAEKITVIKGASGLQYSGDAVGGLVSLEPVQMKKDTLFGKAIATLASNGKGGSLSTSIHKGNEEGFGWNLWNTLKYMGDREAPDYVLSNTGNKEINFAGDIHYDKAKYDLTAFMSYYNTEIGILSASHTGNATDLYNSINNKIPAVINNFTYQINNPKQEVQHYLGKLRFCFHFNGTSFITSQYSFQYNKRLEYDIRRGDYKDIPALNLELTTNNVNIDYKKTTHDWTLKSGASGLLQSNAADPSTGVRPLIPNYNKIDVGAYSILIYNFSESFSADAGIRYDYSDVEATKYYQKSRWEERGYQENFSDFIVGETGNQWLTKPTFTYHNFSASLGCNKELENDWQLLANMSSASRNPNPAELFSDGVHHSSGTVELGDLNLNKEQSFKLSVTLLKKWKPFSFELNPYINAIKNFMYLSPTAFETNIRGTFPVWEYKQTEARLSGIDLRTNWNINEQFQHILITSYVNGKDITNKAALIDIPPLRLNNKLRYYKKEWFGFMAEIEHEVNMRQTLYPNNNFTTNIIQNNELVPVVVDISTPPAGYQLLNFYSEAKFRLSKASTTTVAISVQNLMNTSYRDYLNKQRFFADEVGRNIQFQIKHNF